MSQRGDIRYSRHDLAAQLDNLWAIRPKIIAT
jgi:hypothetical protein